MHAMQSKNDDVNNIPPHLKISICFSSETTIPIQHIFPPLNLGQRGL
jgi:hypothetical protein